MIRFIEFAKIRVNLDKQISPFQRGEGVGTFFGGIGSFLKLAALQTANDDQYSSKGSQYSGKYPYPVWIGI